MTVAYLSDYPHLAPVIARWLFDIWGHATPGKSLDDWVRDVAAHANRERLPLALVGLDGDALIGTAALHDYDMETRPDLSPWLANVYVATEHRHHSYGSQLVQAAEAEARRLGIAKLYLYTPDQERLYRGLNWRPLERQEYRGEQVVIMQREL